VSNSPSGGRRVRPDSFYFDKLPRRLREALCHSSFEWDSKWFYDRWSNGVRVDALIKELRKWNLRECDKPCSAKVRNFYLHNNPHKLTRVTPL